MVSAFKNCIQSLWYLPCHLTSKIQSLANRLYSLYFSDPAPDFLVAFPHSPGSLKPHVAAQRLIGTCFPHLRANTLKGWCIENSQDLKNLKSLIAMGKCLTKNISTIFLKFQHAVTSKSGRDHLCWTLHVHCHKESEIFMIRMIMTFIDPLLVSLIVSTVSLCNSFKVVLNINRWNFTYYFRTQVFQHFTEPSHTLKVE